MKYSYEQRLVIVTRVKRGEAIAYLSKKYPINETQILAWVRMVRRLHGGVEPVPHLRAVVMTLWKCFQAVAQAAPSFGTAFLASSGWKWALEVVPCLTAGRRRLVEAVSSLGARCADGLRSFFDSVI